MALVGFNPQFHTGAATRSLKLEPRRPHGELHAEAERLRWLQGRLPVPALCFAHTDERQSYLLTAEVPGADASDERWLADPARLVALLAEGLLLIHRQPIVGCPFDQRLNAELDGAAANVAAGVVDADDFDEERVGRNLGERWVAPFFAAYGIGEPDEARLRYYQLLDELF